MPLRCKAFTPPQPLPPFSIERRGENEGGQCAPVAGLKLRKMASSEQQRGAKESSQAAQAAPSRLQALFLRRQSGMGMKAGNKRPV